MLAAQNLFSLPVKRSEIFELHSDFVRKVIVRCKCAALFGRRPGQPFVQRAVVLADVSKPIEQLEIRDAVPAVPPFRPFHFGNTHPRKPLFGKSRKRVNVVLVKGDLAVTQVRVEQSENEERTRPLRMAEKPLKHLLRGDRIAVAAQHIRVRAAGDDLAVHEHAVPIEDDKVNRH